MAEPWSLFPGVYSTLVDNSIAVINTSSASTGFICFMSEKGPDNQLVLNSRVDQLLTKYGNVDVARFGQGLKIGIQYLNYANSLYTIRVTPDRTNTPSMSKIYGDLYGKYSKSTIEMKEAAYANIGIACNANEEFEFIHIGPEDLGTIKSLTTMIPPTTANVNDRYYVPIKKNDDGTIMEASGAWKGHEGDLMICTSSNPVKWVSKEIADTSIATVSTENGTAKMCAAVTYELPPSDATWRDYNNVYMSSGYTLVKDVIDTLPQTQPEDGDSYLICSNPIDTDFAGHENQVITYSEDLDEWSFSIYNKVFVDREYQFVTEPPASVTTGDRFIVTYNIITETKTDNDGNNVTVERYDSEAKYADWKGNEGFIAEKTASGWKFLKFDVAEPEETDKFQSLVISQYISETESTRLEYSRQVTALKNVIWTLDTNADFLAYAHRMTQFNDIIESAIPSASKEHNSLEPFIIFYPLGRGTYYNGMHVDMRLTKQSQYVIENDFDKELIVDIYNTVDGNKLKVESFTVSFNPNKKDLQGNSMFISDVINTYSNYVRVAINEENFGEDINFCKNIHEDIATLFERYKLRNSVGGTALPPKFEHGDDGNIFDSYGNINWEVATSLLCRAYTGTIVNPAALDPNLPYETAVLDREEVLFDLIFDAGYPGDVKVAIFNLIEQRHNDCFGVLDLGDNASAEAAIKARTQEGGVGTSFNTPFVAIYEPYSLVYDAFSGRDIWISPVYHAVRALALTDSNYGRWQAAAGTKRGTCVGIKKLRYNLNLDTSYQDLFVTYMVNPIIKNRDGFLIWGNSTSQLTSSKLQDINVVRLVIRIKRELEFGLRPYIFDLNEPATWQKMNSTVTNYLSDLVSRGALTSFASQVYASDYDIARHRVNVDVMLQPKQVIYQILLTISV